mmetsp:Transcript_26362/g.59920  ORF Transcript_26362/g.59920 Transcript_26362/m.59920 type:complete len:100 (-) Transcript_26362:1625-1924(-)
MLYHVRESVVAAAILLLAYACLALILLLPPPPHILQALFNSMRLAYRKEPQVIYEGSSSPLPSIFQRILPSSSVPAPPPPPMCSDPCRSSLCRWHIAHR